DADDATQQDRDENVCKQAHAPDFLLVLPPLGLSPTARARASCPVTFTGARAASTGSQVTDSGSEPPGASHRRVLGPAPLTRSPASQRPRRARASCLLRAGISGDTHTGCRFWAFPFIDSIVA